MCTTITLRFKKKHQSRKRSRVKSDTAKLENEDYLKAFTISLKKKNQVLENRTPAKEDNEEVERDSKIRNQQENIKHKVGKNQEPTKIIICGKR